MAGAWAICLNNQSNFPEAKRTLASARLNAALYYHSVASSRDRITDAESIATARRGVELDWVRVAGATAAFVAPLRALTLAWPGQVAAKDPLAVRVGLGLVLLGVAAFVLWFVSNI